MNGTSGIDVSHHNGIFNWDKAKSENVIYAFMRAVFGYTHDKQFERNWIEAKKAGIARGAYGWVIHGFNQVKTAKVFVDRVKHDIGELPIVVDFENTANYGKPTFSELQAFIKEIERLLPETKIIIYTSQGYWNGLVNSVNQTWALKYDLWVANYTLASKPSMPSVWINNNVPYTFWQFTENGDGLKYGSAGKNLDLNRFNGTNQELFDYIGDENTIPTPPDPIEKTRVEILVNQLWGRSEPIFESRTHSVITRDGEIYEKAGETKYEKASGITWQPIKIPERIVYVSANTKYIKERI